MYNARRSRSAWLVKFGLNSCSWAVAYFFIKISLCFVFGRGGGGGAGKGIVAIFCCGGCRNAVVPCPIILDPAADVCFSRSLRAPDFWDARRTARVLTILSFLSIFAGRGCMSFRKLFDRYCANSDFGGGGGGRVEDCLCFCSILSRSGDNGCGGGWCTCFRCIHFWDAHRTDGVCVVLIFFSFWPCENFNSSSLRFRSSTLFLK